MARSRHLENILLATGAGPMWLPIDGAELAMDSSAFLELDDLPRQIVFIGGGSSHLSSPILPCA